MRYLPDGTWMQRADSHTIQEIGIPSMVLMERAALKTVEVMEQEGINLSSALIVCGSGNNGGDGFAVARLLKEKGFVPTVVFAGRETSLSAECRAQKEIVEKLGILPCTEIPQGEYTVVIDALFGVGLSRDIEGRYAQILEQMNEIQAKKVAVDVPSGVHAATGKIMGTAFRADLTVTFACEKLGCVFYPGKSYSGKTVPVDIGIGTEIFKKQEEIAYTFDKEDLGRLLPKRKPDSHKGTYGKVLMITGSRGMAGAAYLSAKAAYAVGAGLVQIYTDRENRAILQGLLPEAILSVYEEGSENQEQLSHLLEWADVVCIGCGLGQSKTAEVLLAQTLCEAKVPCIVDADGLNLLSRHMEFVREKKSPVILTPHMAEMARLSGCTVGEIKEDRMGKLDSFAEMYDVICALKDSRTVVAKKGRQKFVNTAGNNAMAKAGSGDVLAGVITGLMAQHMEPFDGCALGVYLHACGGDEAREEKGNYSVMAQDLISGVQACLKKIKETK